MTESLKLELVLARLTLRPLQPAQAEAIAMLLSDERVTRWMPEAPRSCSTEYAQRMIMRSAMLLHAGRAINLGIFARDSDTVMGEITLDLAIRELGIWLGPRFWRKNYGSEALQAGLELAHEVAGLDKVCAMIQRGNQASCRLFEKNGFAFTGLVFRSAPRGSIPYLDYQIGFACRGHGHI